MLAASKASLDKGAEHSGIVRYLSDDVGPSEVADVACPRAGREREHDSRVDIGVNV